MKKLSAAILLLLSPYAFAGALEDFNNCVGDKPITTSLPSCVEILKNSPKDALDAQFAYAVVLNRGIYGLAKNAAEAKLIVDTLAQKKYPDALAYKAYRELSANEVSLELGCKSVEEAYGLAQSAMTTVIRGFCQEVLQNEQGACASFLEARRLDPSAINNYIYGEKSLALNCPGDPKDFIAALEQSASLGIAEANIELANIYVLGEVTPTDYAKAIVYARAASIANPEDARAHFLLGYSLIQKNAQTQTKDKAEIQSAIENLTLASDKGDTDASYALFKLYIFQPEFEVLDLKKGISYGLLAAAKPMTQMVLDAKGNKIAQSSWFRTLEVAELFGNNNFPYYDQAKAMELYELAARNDYAPAIITYIEILCQLGYGDKALDFAKNGIVAEANKELKGYALALAYILCNDTPKLKEAYELLKPYADPKGNSDFIINNSDANLEAPYLLYQLATATPAELGLLNDKEATSYLSLASERGSIKADYVLGALMLNGERGVPVDIMQGLKLLRRSAKGNFYDAKLALALIYEEGLYNQKQNLRVAKEIYLDLAKQGLNYAHRRLVELLIKEQDPEAAYSWLKELQSCVPAEPELQELEIKLKGLLEGKDLKPLELKAKELNELYPCTTP